MKKQGWYRDLPETEYFGDPALNSSIVKKKTAIAMKSELDGNRDLTPAQINAFAQGTATHLATLQPDRFEAESIVVSTKGLTTKEAEEARAKYPHKAVITADMREIALRQADAVRKHGYAREILEASVDREISGFATDENGIDLKARIDMRPPGANFLADLKTTSTEELRSFRNACVDFGYLIQAPFYLRVDGLITGQPRHNFAFVIVTKTPPYFVRVFQLTEESIHRAHDVLDRRLEIFREAQRMRQWEGYENEGVRVIDIPEWAWEQLEA